MQSNPSQSGVPTATLPVRRLPDGQRLSVLMAALLLAFTLTRFINLPGWELSARPLGILIKLEINIHTMIAFLAAGMMAGGTNWLLSDHPALQDRDGPGIEHWLLPSIVTWVISIPLVQVSIGLLWIAGLVISAVLLALILTAEYIAIDPEDIRHPIAEAGLTAVSFAAYVMLAIALRAAETRLYLVLPALALTAAIISLRTWHLRLGGEWALIEAGLVLLIVGQIVAALHYWPMTALSFGLAALGPAYAMTNLVTSMAQGSSFRQALTSPILALIVTWGAAWLIR